MKRLRTEEIDASGRVSPAGSRPYYRERRYVLRYLASILDEDIARDAPWLTEDDATKVRVDEPTERRRFKAAAAIVADLRARGAR